MRRRLLSLVMCLCMALGFFPALAAPAAAYTNGHTQAEAVAWANGLMGQALDHDGAYGAQCVDLIMYYYEYLGQAAPRGNASDYVNGGPFTPAGWSYQYSPQPGDIAVWVSGPYGHIAIVVEVSGSSYTCVEQNYNNQMYVTRNTRWNDPATVYIRPDFAASTSTPAPTATPAPTPTPRPTPSPTPTPATSGKCGDDVTWSYSDGKLTISGTGDMYDITVGYDPWWAHWDVETVEVKDGVTSIGTGVFVRSNIKAITIPSSVKAIEHQTFYGCSSLESVTMENGVTTIGEEAFAHTAIKSITIPATVTGMYGAFSLCDSIQHITIREGAVSIPERAFSGVDSLETVTLPSTLESVGWGAFASCGSLKSVLFPGKLTKIEDYAFYRCSSLASVTFPSGLQSIGAGAFQECRALKSVALPSGLTSVGSYAFISTGLTGVTIPASVTSIGACAFGYLVEGGNQLVPGFTITGQQGSAAEEYARGSRLTFLPTGGGITPTPKPTATPKPTPAPAAKKNGVHTEGSRQYYYVNGVKQIGKLVTAKDGKMYYCAPGDGHIMKGGTKKVGEVFYYLSAADGHVLKNGWIPVDGRNQYYADKTGALYTGFRTIGKWSYYFSVHDAHMMRGGIVTGLGGKKYYVSAMDGHAMKGGWARGDAVKTRPGYSNYYFLDESGVMRMKKPLPTSTAVKNIPIPKPSEYQY